MNNECCEYEIDLNCDAGESFGIYTIGHDNDLFRYVSSVNIACGFHAGDPLVMKKTVQLAINNKLQIGAHPGFPDIMGFGRREMYVPSEALNAYLIYQMGALDGFMKEYGKTIQHVKPHGALYNMAAKDIDLSRTIAAAIYSYNPRLPFVGLACSAMEKAAAEIGVPFAGETFIDRHILADGLLVPRGYPNAFVSEEECLPRTLAMIKDRNVRSIDGALVKLNFKTLCLHSDNPKSVNFIAALKEVFSKENIRVKPMNTIR
jgi:UPF0271 protein